MLIQISLVFMIFLGCFGFAWAEDCGLRGYDGAKVVRFDCEKSGTLSSPLRIQTATGVRGVKLLNPGDCGATKFRIRMWASGAWITKAIAPAPIQIKTCEELQMIGFHPDYQKCRSYELANNIDCSKTNPADAQHANSLWGKGYALYYGANGFDGIAGTPDDSELLMLKKTDLGAQGFQPIGYSGGFAFPGAFAGQFDGKGKIISNLFINRNSDYIGLFGVAQYASIVNVRVTGGTIRGANDVGGVVGLLNGNSAFYSTLSSSYFQGAVSSSNHMTGGLVGSIHWSRVTSSYATGTVVASTVGACAGGLVGSVNDSVSIDASYANVTVSGGYQYYGGLVGCIQYNASISNSFSIGTVTGPYSGQLIGFRGASTMTNNWWWHNTGTLAVGSPAATSASTASKAGAVSDFYNTGYKAAGRGGNVYSSQWDFTNVWQANSTDLPTLR